MLKINDVIMITHIENVDPKDYPDMVDAFASEGYWISTEKPLTDEELDNINDNYSNEIQEVARELI